MFIFTLIAVLDRWRNAASPRNLHFGKVNVGVRFADLLIANGTVVGCQLFSGYDRALRYL
jgi:hypothetical protein